MGFSVCLPLPSDGQLQNHWDFVLSSFAPDGLYVLGDEAEAPSTNVFARMGATYLGTAEELPDVPLVLLAPKVARYVSGEIDLNDFEHPDECIYLFGPDNLPLSSDHLGEREPEQRVYVPTDTNDDLYAHVAYAITMWDRRVKHG